MGSGKEKDAPYLGGLHLKLTNTPVEGLESYTDEIRKSISETRRARQILREVEDISGSQLKKGKNAAKKNRRDEDDSLEGGDEKIGVFDLFEYAGYASTAKFLHDGFKSFGFYELLPSLSQVAKSIPSFAEMRAASAAALAEDTIIAANARMLLNPITAALAMIPVTNYAYQKIYDTDENIWQGSKNFWAENDTAETLYKYHEGIVADGGYARAAGDYYMEELLLPSYNLLRQSGASMYKSSLSGWEDAKYFWAGNDAAGDVYEFLRATPDYIKSLLPDYLKKNKADESVEGDYDEKGDNSSGALGNMFSAFTDFFSPKQAFAYDAATLSGIGNYHGDSMRGLTDSAPETLAPQIKVTVNQPPIQNKVNMLVNLYEDGRQYVETDLNTELKIDVRRGHMD